MALRGKVPICSVLTCHSTPQGIKITLGNFTLVLEVPITGTTGSVPWRNKYSSQGSMTIPSNVLNQMARDNVFGYTQLKALWEQETSLNAQSQALGPLPGGNIPPQSGPSGIDRRTSGPPPSGIPRIRPEMSGREDPFDAKKRQSSLEGFTGKTGAGGGTSSGPTSSQYACRPCKGNGNRCGKELPNCGACTQSNRQCYCRPDPGPKCQPCQQKGYECDRGFPCNMCPGKKGVNPCRYTGRTSSGDKKQGVTEGSGSLTGWLIPMATGDRGENRGSANMFPGASAIIGQRYGGQQQGTGMQPISMQPMRMQPMGMGRGIQQQGMGVAMGMQPPPMGMQPPTMGVQSPRFGMRWWTTGM